ncbi:terminase small subunit [Aureimonas altamirensis]|uniref:terminase small subunit n=1 Tax=Aureimonas altamirensis TaxID=370622 RepID=UPI00301A95C5
MIKNRKQRVDSKEQAVASYKAAAVQIQPPSNVPLTAAELPFYVSIIAEGTAVEWTAHQCETAALLARAMFQLSKEQRKLDTEDSIYYDKNGEPKANPRAKMCASLMSQIVTMRRSLAIHARAKHGEPRDHEKRRQYQRAYEADNPLGDDLLARPN